MSFFAMQIQAAAEANSSRRLLADSILAAHWNGRDCQAAYRLHKQAEVVR
jgi:hypothetical protein